MTARVLITGGSGFLGNSIAERLLREDAGASVTIIDPRPPTELLQRFPDRVVHGAQTISEFLAAPLSDTTFPHVIHLAWESHPATSMQFPLKDLNANVGLGIELLEGCSRLGVETLIFASSGGTVYGLLEGETADETHPTNPVSVYGAAKLSFEHYAQVYAWHMGFKAMSLRVSNPYGAYQFKGLPVGSLANFLLAARDGRQIVLYGDGSVTRDYIAIDDVAAAFHAAVSDRSLPPGAYNIGTGIGTSLAGIVDLVEGVSGRPLDIDRQPARAFDVPRNVLDFGRFRQFTGWRPQTTLVEGARAMWEALKRQNGYDTGVDRRAM